MENSVAIIIPVFNRLNDTISCLKSLRKINYKSHKIFIIDDGSYDGTKKYIKRKFDEVSVIRGDGNLWYSGSINIGFKKVLEKDFDFVLLLNNDNVVDPNFLTHLVQSTSYFDNRTIICSLVKYNFTNNSFRFGGGKIVKSIGISFPYSKNKIQSLIKKGYPYNTDYAGGMGIILRKLQVLELGFLDEKHFPMCGDGEYWLRATRKKGFKLVINPKAIVYGSTGQGNIRETDSIKQLFRSLVNIRSGQNFKYKLINYYRYYPKLLLPYYMIVFYIYYILGGIILILLAKVKKVMASAEVYFKRFSS